MIYIVYNIFIKEILYQNFFGINEEEAKEVALWYAMDWGIDNIQLVCIKGYDSIEDYDKTLMEERVNWIEKRVGKNKNVLNIPFEVL